MVFDQMDDTTRKQAAHELKERHQLLADQGLALNMARGKPAPAQLDLSMPLLEAIAADKAPLTQDGTDCRNYGVLDGIPEAKELMAVLLDDEPDNVVVCGNSSLNIEYDVLAHCMLNGPLDAQPWSRTQAKWLCPVPGYDRHFSITQSMGIEMINVPMDNNGPILDDVEELVASDPSVKGIWCVPQYSNPTGCTYSNDVVRRLASMECAAKDFRIFWDNAYCVHHLYGQLPPEHVLDIGKACREAGNPNRYYKFASTSKITFPGSGIAGIAASATNIADIKGRMGAQTIGHDKINQLRHVRFLRDAQGIDEHMLRHAAIIGPKFDLVLGALQRELDGWGCEWSTPAGGYFVCFFGPKGTASRIVELCAQAGVALTPAGAPFPYGIDPADSVIRLAPTYPTINELAQAMDVFCLCAKIACLEQ